MAAEDSKLKHLDDENFGSFIGQGVSLVDFFAEWCGPCHMQTPILESLAKELDGQIAFGKVDIDHAQKITAEYQVTSVPTMVIFKDGQEAKRLIGLRDADALKAALESV